VIGWRGLSPSHVLTRSWEEFKARGESLWHVTGNRVAFPTGPDVTEKQDNRRFPGMADTLRTDVGATISAILEYQIVYSSSRSLKLVTVVE
jgi:hypothetical protein